MNGPTRAEPGGRPTFRDQLGEVSRLAKAVGGAVVAVQGVLLAYLLVPEQLEQLEVAAPALCAVGLLMSWVAHRRLDGALGSVVATAGVTLVALLVVNQIFVETVPYADGDRHFLLGYALDREAVEGAQRSLPEGIDITRLSAEGLIAELGPDVIPRLWKGFDAVRVGYVLLFSAFAFAGALAFGGAANRSLGSAGPAGDGEPGPPPGEA